MGAAGQLLNRMLGEIGLGREEVYIANIVKCRPPGNRDPQPDEIEACTPWLVEQISLIQPRVVVTLGNFATKFVLDTTTGHHPPARPGARLARPHRDPHVPPGRDPARRGEKSRQFQLLREDFALVQRTLEGVRTAAPTARRGHVARGAR